jgi:hypothetical protein
VKGLTPMGTLSRFESFRKTRAGKLILGGAAAGMGAAAGTALGADRPDPPNQVSLGPREEGRDDVVLNLEGRKASVKGDNGLVRDDLDSRVGGAATTTGTNNSSFLICWGHDASDGLRAPNKPLP